MTVGQLSSCHPDNHAKFLSQRKHRLTTLALSSSTLVLPRLMVASERSTSSFWQRDRRFSISDSYVRFERA